MQPIGRYFRWALLDVLAICLVSSAACYRPPQIAQENRRLIASLRTAVTAHRSDWLEQNDKAIDQRHAAGSLSEDEYAAFKSIMEHANQGRWAEAESEVFKLAKSQQPLNGEPKRGSPPDDAHP